MKRRRMRGLAAALALLVCLGLSGCRRDINYIVDHMPCVRGTVLEVREGSLLIRAEEEDETHGGAEIEVSRDVERKDSMTDFAVGSKVAVYYDGIVAETYPLQIDKVYAILLLEDAQ